MMRCSKVLSLSELLEVRYRLMQQERIVVFTNGCFDIIHVGHIRFLEEAKSLGDVLIVGINDDNSVKHLKGVLRPIIPQVERAEIISALEFVDYVTIFQNTTPRYLISILKPDIHCKGGDYLAVQPIPEAEEVASYGGQMRILSLAPNRSTTKIIESILQRYKS